MKVTVCELPDTPAEFERRWQVLADHVHGECSGLVLLPAMPFARWFSSTRRGDTQIWNAACWAHDRWESRLGELAPAMVATTRPMDFGNERYEQAFVHDIAQGFRGVHAKAALRDAPGYRETGWYNSAEPDFVPQELHGIAMGFLLDAELGWVTQAESYGREGVQLLLAPRCTNADSEWLAAAQRAAAAAHSYLLSSNRTGPQRHFGGSGWIIDTQGALLGCTEPQRPFLTLDIELVSLGADHRTVQSTQRRQSRTSQSRASW
jgi:predicted amidohydrolase